MRKLKILVISLILVMFFNYFAPIVYKKVMKLHRIQQMRAKKKVQKTK